MCVSFLLLSGVPLCGRTTVFSPIGFTCWANSPICAVLIPFRYSPQQSKEEGKESGRPGDWTFMGVCTGGAHSWSGGSAGGRAASPERPGGSGRWRVCSELSTRTRGPGSRPRGFPGCCDCPAVQWPIAVLLSLRGLCPTHLTERGLPETYVGC